MVAEIATAPATQIMYVPKFSGVGVVSISWSEYSLLFWNTDPRPAVVTAVSLLIVDPMSP